MKNTENKALSIERGMCFYFKVNNSKLNNPEIMERQITKICNRFKDKYNLKLENICFNIGAINDDFIHNNFRLRIYFNCV